MNDDEALDGLIDAHQEIARLRQALAVSEIKIGRQRAEIQHRVRNLLSVVRAVSSRSIERAVSLEELAMHQGGRVSALARVEEALDLSSGLGADLEHLLWDEWLVVLSCSEEWRARAQGPPVLLAPKAAERIGLAFHELTTNALKFGALSTPEGQLGADWRVVEEHLEIAWTERGVRLMNASPKHIGFGRDLLERGLAYDLCAETEMSFAPGGLKCVIRLPLRGNIAERGGSSPGGRTTGASEAGGQDA